MGGGFGAVAIGVHGTGAVVDQVVVDGVFGVAGAGDVEETLGVGVVVAEEEGVGGVGVEIAGAVLRLIELDGAG
jgi:hypothetical protein